MIWAFVQGLFVQKWALHTKPILINAYLHYFLWMKIPKL